MITLPRPATRTLALAWVAALAAGCRHRSAARFSRGSALAIALAIAAGCLTPAAPPAADAPEATLPGSLDVDLREDVLDITMPEDEPTVLVALNAMRSLR